MHRPSVSVCVGCPEWKQKFKPIGQYPMRHRRTDSTFLLSSFKILNKSRRRVRVYVQSELQRIYVYGKLVDLRRKDDRRSQSRSRANAAHHYTI